VSLPKGWIEPKLGDVTSYKKGKKPKILKDIQEKDMIPYIDIKAFEKGIIRQYADIESSVFVDEKNFLIVWDGARSGLTGRNISGALGSTIMKVDASGFDNDYIYRFFQFKYADINSNTKGTGIPHVDPAYLWNIKIPIAPLNEQKRIAKKLDELLATVESIKTRLDNAPSIIKRFRQSILAAATSGKLTEEWREENGIDNKWELSSFSKLGSLSRGKSKHRPRNDPQLFGGDYPFIQTGAVAQSGGLITEHSKTLSEFGLKQSRLFPENTLCITIAANIADTAFLTYPTCFPDSVVGFIADEEVCQREFIKYFIDVNKDNLETFAPATAQKNINLTILNALEIPIPTLIEQKEIVSQVESLFALDYRRRKGAIRYIPKLFNF